MQRSNFIMLVALVNVFLLDPSCGTQEVCYGKYGCFSKASPFDNKFVKLPQEPSSVGTTFKLFTRSNRNNAQLVDDSNEEKLQRSSFDISKRTIVIVHGWKGKRMGASILRRKESDSSSWVPRMKDALLDREDCNVILVGWSEGSNTAYKQASGNTRLVGVQIAELIRFLISSNSGSSSWADRFYIVGFSLGAQIAGYAGRHLLTEGMSLGRITGLDPAGPYFGGRNAALHLDRSDAKYVDVIHTDLGFAGTPLTVSDIDFFPNGGRTQPGCPIFPNLSALEQFFACSHMRAPEYYIASVKNECSWKAHPCSNSIFLKLGFCKKCNGECPSMGYFADQTKRTGKYYLRTNSKAPFCGLD